MKKQIYLISTILILLGIAGFIILENKPTALAADVETEEPSSKENRLSEWKERYSPESIEKIQKYNEEKSKEKRKLKQDRFNSTEWLWHEDYSFYNHGEKRKSLLKKDYKFKEYNLSKISLIEILSSTAFSDHLWLNHFTGSPVNFLYRSFQHNKKAENLPKHNVINKWNKPLKITLKTLKNNKQVDTKKYAYLIEHIKEFAKKYSEASGLEITYEHSVYPDKGDANVFIILDADSKIFNAFKNQANNKFINDHEYEQAIFGGVRLTPDSQTQVEGFFVPNKDNEIQQASCYLKPEYLNESYIKKLTAECMLRILGFPEKNETLRNSLLAEWNKKIEPISARPTHDSELKFDKNKKEQWKENLSKKIEEVDSDKFSPFDKSPAVIAPMDLDLKLLSILYCKDVKPGMDKYQFIATLINNENCFK